MIFNINDNREMLAVKGTAGTQNENIATSLEFNVPERFLELPKTICFFKEDETPIGKEEFVGNSYLLKKSITKYQKVLFCLKFIENDLEWITELKPLVFNKNLDTDSDITEEDVNFIKTIVNILENEIKKVERLNVTSQETEDGVEITFTDKEGQQKVELVKNGKDGKNAEVNGYNTIEIIAGENVEIKQDENKLEISATGGGEGGTTNYNQLTNKPKINNVELSENKTLKDLGIINFSGNYNDLSNKPTIPTKVSELENDSHYIDNTYHDSSKQDTISDLDNIRSKANSALQEIPSEYITETELNNYHDSSKQDTINDLETIRDGASKGATALQKIPSEYAKVEDIPTKTSELENDSGFLTEHQDINNKLDKPTDTPAVGKVLAIKQVNDDGTFVCEWVEQSGGSDLDVQINGKSIVQDGIAKIPMTGYIDEKTVVREGLVFIPSGYGLSFQWNTHYLIIDKLANGIQRRNTVWQAGYYALLLNQIDDAVKAAMCDGQGAAWTEAEQKAAQERIGIKSVEEVLF